MYFLFICERLLAPASLAVLSEATSRLDAGFQVSRCNLRDRMDYRSAGLDMWRDFKKSMKAELLRFGDGLSQ